MIKPTFRFFIVPLGAICTIATLAIQNAPSRAAQDDDQAYRQAVHCSQQSPSDLCVIAAR